MLNEVPNNNDVTYVTYIVLNEVPNSNDVTCIANDVLLTTISLNYHGHTTVLNGSFIAIMPKKPTYQR